MTTMLFLVQYYINRVLEASITRVSNINRNIGTGYYPGLREPDPTTSINIYAFLLCRLLQSRSVLISVPMLVS